MMLSTIVHNTTGITLDQFISIKPKELRLGQWFVNCYCKPVGHWSAAEDTLFYVDDEKAKELILMCMDFWQWDMLPLIAEK